jgi:hypothetical protein
LAHGTLILFLDSDDELMNRTAEIDFNVHQLTGADVVEHKMLQFLSGGRIAIFEWREAPFREANNSTLTAAVRKGIMNWTLPRKMIERLLYQQALVFLGSETCKLPILWAEDQLQVITLYRFVHKFVTVDYFGYLYYTGIPDNSRVRVKRFPWMASIAFKHLALMYARRKPDSIDERAVRNFCDAIEQ